MKKKINLDPLGFLLFVFIIINVALGMYLGETYQQFSTIILLPIITILSIRIAILYHSGETNKILIYFILLVLYSLVGVFFLEDYSRFSDEFRKMIYTLMAVISVYILVKNKGIENYIHISFIVSIILMIYFAYLNGNYILDGFASLKGRRNRFLYNANYYSYISYFANFSLFYLYLKNKSKVLLISCIISFVLFLVLAFITQSRSGLLFVLLINFTFWYLIDKTTNKQFFKRLFRFTILFSLGIFFLFKLIDIYSNSNIERRVSNTTEESRSELAKQGLEVFIDHPLTGVGLGQFPLYTRIRQFTHNSYAEVLAEHGVLGGILLALLLFTPFFKSIWLLQKSSSPILKLQALFFFTFILYNNFYVFYKFPYSMLYFFMFIALQWNESSTIADKTS